MLAIYTIYENPADHPGKFCVRRFVIDRGNIGPDAMCIVADSLAEARTHVPNFMFNIGRMFGDEPQIVESWI